MNTAGKPYPMDEGAVRAFSDAAWWARYLLDKGTREPHGVYPNRPLTPAMRRDAAIVERALHRLFDADRRNR